MYIYDITEKQFRDCFGSNRTTTEMQTASDFYDVPSLCLIVFKKVPLLVLISFFSMMAS